MKKNNYNTTDLDPLGTFEKHVFHRDQFAHYLRWTHVLKLAKPGQSICDFGCGKANLLEVLYRNRFTPSLYTGIDIRKKTIEKNKEKFKNVDFANFLTHDLLDLSLQENLFVKTDYDFVCSFEVLEHVGKQNGEMFMQNFKFLGDSNTCFLLSTPLFDEKVGAAKNHTYDSGDGRGVQPQEYALDELINLLEKHFIINKMFGTFASKRDYSMHMSDWQIKMLNELSKYYDSNLISNIMAPMFPEHSRNIIFNLTKK